MQTHTTLNLTFITCKVRNHHVKQSHNSVTTEVLFAQTSVIAFLDALNFEACTAWIASDDQHVAYETVALDEFYTTAYSDLYEQ
jgi:hypothetical protein